MNFSIKIRGHRNPTIEETGWRWSLTHRSEKQLLTFQVTGLLTAGVNETFQGLEAELKEILYPKTVRQFLQDIGDFLDTEETSGRPLPDKFEGYLDCSQIRAVTNTNPDYPEPGTAEEINETLIIGFHQGHTQTVPQERETNPGIRLVSNISSTFRQMINAETGPDRKRLVEAAAQQSFFDTFGVLPRPKEQIQEPGEEDYENVYCPLCTGCGESGCCSPSMCKGVVLHGSYCKGNILEYKEMEKEFCNMAETIKLAILADPENEALKKAYEKAKNLASWI